MSTIVSVSITSMSMSAGPYGYVTADWSMQFNPPGWLFLAVTIETDQSATPGAPDPSSPYYQKGGSPDSGQWVESGADNTDDYTPACGSPRYLDLRVTGQLFPYTPAVSATRSIPVAPSC